MLKATQLALFALVTTVFALVLHSPAHAAKTQEMSVNDRAVIEKVTAYINNIRNLQGEFTQVSPKGKISSGVFYISKPGKLRFEYAAPNPFLIVSDGTWLTVQNRARNKSDQYPLSKTPLRLMLANNINLFKQAIIRQVKDKDGIITVALEDRDQLVAGHLVLVFNDTTKALQQWIVVDGQGRRTTVSLVRTVQGTRVDPRLFIVKTKDRSQSKVDK